MKSEFLLAFNQICNDRGLSREVVLDALQSALVSAYRKNVDADPGQHIVAEIELGTAKSRIFVEKRVVEDVSNPLEEITLQGARTIDPEVEMGGTVMVDSTPEDFGRIAAQNAKQIILQRIREAERDARYSHYVGQEGEIVHGVVQSVKPHAVTLHLDGTEAILPRNQQVPGERYNVHQRLRAYVLEVRKTGRGPQITLSRSHQDMLRRLLELEVPEIFNGAVEIKSIAREAGSRSKVAVAARQAGVDPVGACVGMRGVRIQSIVNELGGEKIDVVEWSPDPSQFIAKALSPAKVLSVQLDDDPVGGKTANVVVPDDQLSLAIGRAGQNARLAAKLTSWRIDIQGVTEAATWAFKQINEDENVLPALGSVAELLPRVASILAQHEQEDLPYNSEEMLVMRQVIEAVGDYYASIRDAERARLLEEEAARRAAIQAAQTEREATIEAALSRIPDEAYDIVISDIGLSTRVLGHLERADLENVGQVMELMAEGDEGLLMIDGVGPKSLAEIKACLDELDLSQPEEEPVTEEPELVAAEAEAPEVEAVEAEAEPVVEEGPAEQVSEPEPAAEVEQAAPEVAEVEPGTAEPESEEEDAGVVEVFEIPKDEYVEEELYDEEDEAKQHRQRQRQLVYDEELDEVIAVRRHRRGEDDEEDWQRYI